MSSDVAVSGVLDANVLIYAHTGEEAERYSGSAILLDLARSGGQEFAVTPQVLMEFYSVITSPKRVSKPLTPQLASAAISRLLAMPGISLLPYPVDLIDRIQTLLEIHPVTGGAVYDLQIVATMLGNGVTTVYTYNRKDFEPFIPEIRVETPFTA